MELLDGETAHNKAWRFFLTSLLLLLLLAVLEHLRLVGDCLVFGMATRILCERRALEFFLDGLEHIADTSHHRTFLPKYL